MKWTPDFGPEVKVVPEACSRTRMSGKRFTDRIFSAISGPTDQTGFGDGDRGLPQIGRSVAIDGHGQVLAGGSFDGTMDFGDGRVLRSNGAAVFLALLDSSGAVIWRRPFGSDALEDLVSGLAFAQRTSTRMSSRWTDVAATVAVV